jgi:hypothetical protein
VTDFEERSRAFQMAVERRMEDLAPGWEQAFRLSQGYVHGLDPAEQDPRSIFNKGEALE